LKVLDVTEFYSERGGGVRSHLTLKSHVLCQLGHEHVVVAPGPRDADLAVTRATSSANDSTHRGGETTVDPKRDLFPEHVNESRERERGSARIVRIAGPSLPYDPTYHLLWRMDKIRSLVEKERPDVLEIHSPYVAAASALACKRDWFGIRTFCWHSDFIDTYLRVMLERHVKTPAASVILEPLWAMVRGIARGCDATFVAARWQREKLASHGVPRLVQVPFGIERAAFAPEARSEERRRELLGDAHTRAKLLVGIGRFAVEKRWDVVLDAFVRLRASHDAVLVMIGDGPEREAMKARVEGRDDVRFIGFERDRARLASALASADALVHGCPYETFGLSIAEAMSCGLPVVVPDEGGAAELADPSCSEVYPSLDAQACADALARLLARDRDELRRRAVAVSARVPNVRGQFQALIAQYEALLHAPPTSS